MSALPVAAPHALPLLSALIVTPLVASMFARLEKDARRARRIGMAVSALALGLALLELALFDRHTPGFQLVETGFDVPGLPVRFRLGVDGLSVLGIPLVALVTFGVLTVTPTASLTPRVVASVLTLSGLTTGVLSAIDLGAFAVFFVLSIVPAALPFVSRTAERRSSVGVSRVFVAHQVLGACALVTALALLASATTVDGAPLDLAALAAVGVPSHAQGPIFLLLLTAAFFRAGAFPLHAWLPLMITAGPVPVSVVLATAPVGVYTLARIALPLLPDAVPRYADLLTGLALASIVYGALLALVQRDLRRTITFILISQTGLVFLGIAAHNVQGLAGAMLDSLGIGAAVAGILLVTVALEGRIGTASTRDLAGLGKHMPRMAAFFFLFGFATVGFPGSLAFVGEDILMHGMFEIHPVIAAIALLGPALNGFTFLRAFGRTFLGRGQTPAQAPASLRDLLPRERLGVLVLAAVCIVAGLAPQPFLSLQSGAVHAMHPSDEP
jgi:NADH-quinone oxidoreductase subunit M